MIAVAKSSSIYINAISAARSWFLLAVRMQYDSTGHCKSAALFKFVIFGTLSRIVFTFVGDLTHFLAAVRLFICF